MLKKIKVENVEKRGGNTKSPRPNCCTRWCFTWNNYPNDGLDRIIQLCLKKGIQYIIGKEIGELGTPHLQGYICSKRKFRWSELDLPLSIHWEKAKGNKESNIVYCSKDGQYVCSANLKPLTVITKLYTWQQGVLDLYGLEPDGRTIHWYYDADGGKGKSAFCKYMYVHYNVVTIQGGKLNDIMNVIFNLEEIPKMIIIDVPRNNGNLVSYSAIECILNGMITNTKYETGIRVFNAPHVVVLSNSWPDETKLSLDRWKITDLGQD